MSFFIDNFFEIWSLESRWNCLIYDNQSKEKPEDSDMTLEKVQTLYSYLTKTGGKNIYGLTKLEQLALIIGKPTVESNELTINIVQAARPFFYRFLLATYEKAFGDSETGAKLVKDQEKHKFYWQHVASFAVYLIEQKDKLLQHMMTKAGSYDTSALKNLAGLLRDQVLHDSGRFPYDKNEKCKDPILDLIIAHALQNHGKEVTYLIECSKDPLAASLLACAIFRALERADYENQYDQQRRANAEMMENLACAVIQKYNEDSEEKAYHALMHNVRGLGKRNCLDLARSAKAIKFATQAAFQSLTEKLWMGGIESSGIMSLIALIIAIISSSTLLIGGLPFILLAIVYLLLTRLGSLNLHCLIICLIFSILCGLTCALIVPWLLFGIFIVLVNIPFILASSLVKSKNFSKYLTRISSANYSEAKEKWTYNAKYCGGKITYRQFLLDLGSKWNAPIMTYRAHLLSYIIFLVLISYLALFPPRNTLIPMSLALLWVIGFTAEIILDIYKVENEAGIRGVLHKFSEFCKHVMNSQRILAIICFYVGFSLLYFTNAGLREWGQIFVAFSVFAFYISFYEYYQVSKIFGPKLKMALQMMMETVKFLALLVFVVIGWGICQYAILFPRSEFSIGHVINALTSAYYQMFGDFFAQNIIPSRFAEINGIDYTEWCNNNELNNTSEVGQNCNKYNWLVYLFLMYFILITNIMLFSLLIAIFNTAYQEIKEKEEGYWLYQKFDMVIKYSRKSIIPPPINTFTLFQIILLEVAIKIGKIGTDHSDFESAGDDENIDTSSSRPCLSFYKLIQNFLFELRNTAIPHYRFHMKGDTWKRECQPIKQMLELIEPSNEKRQEKYMKDLAEEVRNLKELVKELIETQKKIQNS